MKSWEQRLMADRKSVFDGSKAGGQLHEGTPAQVAERLDLQVLERSRDGRAMRCLLARGSQWHVMADPYHPGMSWGAVVLEP